MKTIYLILLFLASGIFFGYFMARILNNISDFFIRRKVKKQALNESERTFFYNKKPYDLKENIRYEESKKNKGFFKGLFKKKVKGGISDYGNQPRIEEQSREESVSHDRGNVESKSDNTTTANTTPTNRGEQQYSDSTSARGERGISRGNLFEKGKKFD